MPERALAVDALDGREAQVTETGNQPRRLRLTGGAGIGSVGHTCAHVRSHARMLNASRAPGPQMVRPELPPTTALRAGAHT